MLLAIKSEPSAISIGELIGNNTALSGVIPAQPRDERRHVVLTRCEKCPTGDPPVVELFAVSDRCAGCKHNSEENAGKHLVQELFRPLGSFSHVVSIPRRIVEDLRQQSAVARSGGEELPADALPSSRRPARWCASAC